MREHDAIRDLPGVDPMTKTDLFGMECDVVALAGLQGEITDANADAVRAPLVAEVANGGTTPAADLILADRGITVIPDIICSSGGTVLGYFEWVQDMQAFFWSEAEITDQLDRIVDEADGGGAGDGSRRIGGSARRRHDGGRRTRRRCDHAAGSLPIGRGRSMGMPERIVQPLSAAGSELRRDSAERRQLSRSPR